MNLIGDAGKLRSIGRGLSRPECVLTHRSGYLFASDWTGTGGVSIISPCGSVTRILVKGHPPLHPNGIALDKDGSFLIAHLGAEDGGLFRLHPDGTCEPIVTTVDGRSIPPSNFPIADCEGRIWLSVSTKLSPRERDYRAGASTGMIICIDSKGVRVAADGLGYANEIALSADGKYLFVNETFARRLARFTIGSGGALHERTVVATFEAGDFPDGVTLDESGDLWVTSIVSNRVLHIDKNGKRSVVLEDSDAAHLEWIEKAYVEDAMGRPHLDQIKSTRLRNISSLAFGGDDLRTAYLGCLLGDSVVAFDPGVVGQRPNHFDFDINPILKELRFE